MFVIRKRSLPTAPPPPTPPPPPAKLTGILRTPSTSCSPDEKSSKKTRRSVGFADTVGRPLVECRFLPEMDEMMDDDVFASPSNHQSQHDQNSMQPCITHIYYPDRVKWRLVPAKTAKPIRQGPSVTGRNEEQRLDTLGISRAPLFGTFSAIDSPELYKDAMIRACAHVPSIPTEVPGVVPAAVTPLPSTAAATAAAPTSPNVLALMAKLKQRGLIKAEEHAPALPPVGVVIPPPLSKPTPSSRPNRPRHPSKWAPRADVCTFFVNRRDGCNKGAACAFQHDVQMRERRQNEKSSQWPNSRSRASNFEKN